MLKGMSWYFAVRSISLTHCLLLLWQSWKVEAANSQLWVREEDALFQNKTVVGSVVLGAGGRSASACAMLSLTNGHDLFAYSKSLHICHAVTANNIVHLQAMDSMELYKKNGMVVTKTFDGDFLRTPTSTYQVVKTSVDRDTARSLCTADGSQLVVINTTEKQNLLRDLLNTYSSVFYPFDFWLDGSMDNLWTWTFPDGSLMPMDQGTFWSFGAPNNYDRHCVRMRRRSAYLWDDNTCNSNYGYICEKP